MYEELKNKVCQANIELQKHNLVVYSWGNVSEIDRDNNVIAIKPSGVANYVLGVTGIVAVVISGCPIRVICGPIIRLKQANTRRCR